MRDRTILMGGFSKAYAMTGWRVGYLAAPAAMLEGIVKVHQYGIMSAPTTAQDAALVALTSAEPDVERMLQEYDRRRRLLVEGLNRLGLTTFEPRGAFYVFPRITSTGFDSETFAQRLLEEERVAVVPGSAFGPSGEGHVRACVRDGVRATRGGARPDRPFRGAPPGLTGASPASPTVPRRTAKCDSQPSCDAQAPLFAGAVRPARVMMWVLGRRPCGANLRQSTGPSGSEAHRFE